MGLKTCFALAAGSCSPSNSSCWRGLGSFNVGGGGGGGRYLVGNTLAILGGLMYKYDKYKMEDKPSEIKGTA
ncbi:hypothetical protein CCACVL1_05338 [Corchorus capsularis]|uniref:Uncharacterized protein n=1 Tax=Corchorus capsularis TaxID=210143 RepID=A0A1R3JLL2_COCAP|nr:hypothetical protein CCACVL1_05338 [Corchorus capsularis]